MPYTEPSSSSLSRAQRKIQTKARIQARPSTPEMQREQLGTVLEEEQQDMTRTPLSTEEDQGEESGYDPDPEDCDQEQDTDVYTDIDALKVENPQAECCPRHVSFSGKNLSPPQPAPSTPPPPVQSPSLKPSLVEQLPPPILPPRRCPHLSSNNNNCNHNTSNYGTYPRAASAVPQAPRLGKCTTPKTFGQGYDPPFLYPEFIAKSQQSRVNYILTLVDSLVLQMERFGQLTLKTEEDSAGSAKSSSTGAIPKVRPTNSENRGASKANSNRSSSRTSSQSKGKKKTHAEQEVEYDMDYELCMDQIEEFRANRVRACGSCGTGRALDVIRGHLSRADYSDASKLPMPKRRGNSSSSSSGTATVTPNTRPCSPEGHRQPKNNRPPRDLEQLLDPTTDWPANLKKDKKHQRSTLENLFNMTQLSPPTRLTIVAGKRQHQQGRGGEGGAGGGGEAGGAGGGGATTVHRRKLRETSQIPCLKKRNK